MEYKAWIDYAKGYMEGSKMPEKFRAHEFSRIDSYLKKRLVQSDQHSVKGDQFTEHLTPEKMVHNLLETGTPFDYKDVDFDKVWELLKKHHHNNKDKMQAQMPALSVGEDSNPDKNQIYIDKEKTFEDED